MESVSKKKKKKNTSLQFMTFQINPNGICLYKKRSLKSNIQLMKHLAGTVLYLFKCHSKLT